jgi:hypothetical protein
MQPVGVADARRSVELPPTAGAGDACVAVDDVAVVVLLGVLPATPPNPTAKAIMAAPQISEIGFVASDFMSSGFSIVLFFCPLQLRVEIYAGHGFGRVEPRQWSAVTEIYRATALIAQTRE